MKHIKIPYDINNKNQQILVSIVIPTFNRRKKLAYCIKSIYNSNYSNIEIIVVDDHSTDNTYNMVLSEFPKVHIIRNNEEKLLAASRNIGIKKSKGKFIFLIDDDNAFYPTTIKELVNFMLQNTQVGIVGPTWIVNSKGKMFAGVYHNFITGKTYFRLIDKKKFTKPMESADLFNAFMVRRDVFLKVGYFDEKKFPIHYDEADFGERVRKSGYKIMVIPSAKVYRIPKSRKSIINKMRAYYATRNKVLFYWTHGKKPFFILFLFCFLPLFSLYYCIESRKPIPVIMGIIDAICGINNRRY